MNPHSLRRSACLAALLLAPALLPVASHAATPPTATAAASAASDWKPLFDGKSLTGWTVKISGSPLGENLFDTFRVEDGILKVSYDGYDKFDSRFGHLFTEIAYSHYIVRLEYRMFGEKLPDAPEWTLLNSGIMLHAQPPQSMRLDQSFPVSLEFQFLADAGTGPRSTGNVCSPGTHHEMHGALVTRHIVESSAPTFAPDEWVRVEAEVRGNEEIIHRVNGVEVLRYQRPQLDPADRDARRLLEAGAPLHVGHGHLALQAEAQPVWFRNIEIKPLAP
jgi:hypothetical protein